MSQVSRPMQIALVATLLLAVVWFVALRPRSSAGGGVPAAAPAPAAQAPVSRGSGGGAAPGVSGLKSAIDKAHGAVSTASGDAQRAAQSSADGTAPAAPAGGTASAGNPSHAGSASPPVGTRPVTPGAAHTSAGARPHPRPAPHAAAPASRHHPAGAHGPLRVVLAALHAHKAVAIAFLDANSADARAVAQEMRHVSTFGSRAVVLSLPLSRLSDYDFITNRVQVTVAPTVVIVDRRARATEIVGFADRGEIEQRLADALAVKRAR